MKEIIPLELMRAVLGGISVKVKVLFAIVVLLSESFEFYLGLSPVTVSVICSIAL